MATSSADRAGTILRAPERRQRATTSRYRGSGATSDAGFKVLLEHLSDQGISCAQIKSLAKLHKADQSKAVTLDEKLDFIIDHLTRMDDKKPSPLKTLHNRIRNNCLGGEATEPKLIGITEALQRRGLLQVDKTKIRCGSDDACGHPEPSHLP